MTDITSQQVHERTGETHHKLEGRYEIDKKTEEEKEEIGRIGIHKNHKEDKRNPWIGFMTTSTKTGFLTIEASRKRTKREKDDAHIDTHM